jgi:hypothetical protein
MDCCRVLVGTSAWDRPHHGGHYLATGQYALVRGIQRQVMSCVKHFALNSMKNARFKIDVSAHTPRKTRDGSTGRKFKTVTFCSNAPAGPNKYIDMLSEPVSLG